MCFQYQPSDGDESIVWPQESGDLALMLPPYFDFVHELSRQLLRACGQYLQLEPETKLEVLLGNKSLSNEDAKATLSHQSLLRIVQIENSNSIEPLVDGAHQDLSLLTVLPIVPSVNRHSDSTGGLQIYHSQPDGKFSWVALEASCTPGSLVVFPGLLLQHLSRGKIPATVHRIVRVSFSHFLLFSPLIVCFWLAGR